uniref:Nucleosome-remodeling factor subunit NURF301 n=1 Tax=Cacopsylla melanoneura TaxID=428564 RepID=A0A8D9EGK1_9HEMI
MYGRIKRRGRPPKTPNTDRPKFQVHLLKKPQYLKNLESKGLNSPTTSRASSPQVNENTRKGSARKGGKRKSNPPARGRGGTSRRKQSLETDYHYGSDFEDSTDHDDELGLSESETELEKDDLLDDISDDEISLSSFSTTSGTNKKFSYISRMSPEPLWLQTEREILPLELPRSSDDLLIPREHVMQTLSIYEVLRHFKSLIRLSPFRFEDFCAVLNYEEQSNLLVEIHVAVLKAIFREEDTQQTHFGPLDQKDSANSVLYFIDAMTWPEALRSYIESDKYFDSEVLNILNSCEYPYTDIEKRLKVLQFLMDQILITSPVREDLIHEGGFQYDDHCRVCHRVGELLCCETCPAVFHLECVDPPLRDVPQEDWQCNLCKAHKVSGVTDCLPDVEKSGLLCRQEHLGFDRAGRKYWFLSRRIFVESESGECLYYSTPVQFEELLSCLDPVECEAPLCRELNDFKEEIIRQMELTEKLTNAMKGAKKTWFEVENAVLLRERKEREELKQKLLEEEKERERLEQEERERREKEEREREEEEKKKREEEEAKRKELGEQEEKVGEEEEKKKEEDDGEGEKKEGDGAAAEEGGEKKEESAKSEDANNSSQDGKEKGGKEEGVAEEEIMEVDENGDKKQRLTRSKTGSLTPRTFNMDDLRRRSDRIQLNHAKTVSVSSSAGSDQHVAGDDASAAAAAGGSALMGSPGSSTRLTRHKANQIAHGTFLFKLGMEGSFKNYVNQFSANPIALNKTQRNEERDKKRHMSHKFSLTPTGEFKWMGPVYGPRQVLVNSLRATLLQLESSIIPPFMHINWPSLRKPWIAAVNNSVKARDFARAMIVLQACIKPVVYASVWHEQLGHIRLYRLTALEREEKKRLEKKEKKDKEDEEEKNRMTNSWVKYTLGLKHQVWKQKGEEYRIHGQWGWQWLNATRNYKALDCRTVGLRAGAVKYMVQVKDDYGLKILGVEPHIYRYFMRKNEVPEGEPIAEDKDNDAQMKDILTKQPELQKLRIMPPVSAFEEIDISKALLAAGRIQYPKVARKSKLDELLARRMHLKLVEERTLAQKAITNPTSRDLKTPDEISKEIATNRVLMTAIGRKIAIIKQQFTELSRYHQQYKCYSRECNSSRNATLSSCYSYECRKRSKLGRELVSLLSKADVIRKSMNSSSSSPSTPLSSTQPHQLQSADHKYTTLRNVLESKTGPAAASSPCKLPWQPTTEPAATTVAPLSSSGGNDLKPSVQDIKPVPNVDQGSTTTGDKSCLADVKSEPTTTTTQPTTNRNTGVEPEPEPNTNNKSSSSNSSSTSSSVDKPMEVDTKEEEVEGEKVPRITSSEKSEALCTAEIKRSSEETAMNVDEVKSGTEESSMNVDEVKSGTEEPSMNLDEVKSGTKEPSMNLDKVKTSSEGSSMNLDEVKTEKDPGEQPAPEGSSVSEDVKPTRADSIGHDAKPSVIDRIADNAVSSMEEDSKPVSDSTLMEVDSVSVKPESSTRNITSTPSLAKGKIC